VSPDAINREHGKPVWTCYGCKAEAGLHWWNGLSVAVCDKPECHAKYRDDLSREIQAERDYEDYIRENAPW
jgi:hypothetical protein